MEKKDTWNIPLKLNIMYDDPDDLTALKTSDEFLNLIFEGAVAALKQAIRKNKSECILFEIVNLEAKIKIDKTQYEKLLSRCLSYYEKLEDYDTCQELVELKHRF
jgi:hypothetical protein